MRALSGGAYLSRNLRSLKQRVQMLLSREKSNAAPAEPIEKPVVMLTECGFAVLMALARRLGPDGPIFINLVMYVIVIWLAFLCVRVCIRGSDAGILGGAAAVLLCLYLPLSDALMKLLPPLRDMSAHALGLAGLLCALLTYRHPARAGLLAGLSGVCIALATWMRMANLFLAVGPALVFLATACRGRDSRSRRQLFAFIIGLALGGIPLIAQAILEGRWIPGLQVDALVIRKTAWFQAHPGRGLRPAHVLTTVPGVMRELWDLLSAVGVAGVLAGCLAARRRSLRREVTILLAAASGMIVLYACYHKTVGRYLAVIGVIACILSGIGVAALWDRAWAGRTNGGAGRHPAWRRRVWGLCMTAALCAILATASNSPNALRQLRGKRAQAIRIATELDQIVGPQDQIHLPHPHLRGMLYIFGRANTINGNALLYAAMIPGGSRLHNLLTPHTPAGGHNYITVLKRLDSPRESKSAIEYLLLEAFDVRSVARIDNAAGYQIDVRELVARPTNRTVSVEGDAPFIAIWSRTTGDTNRPTPILIRHGDGAHPIRTRLRTGVNIYAVPANSATATTTITIDSTHPLPSFHAAEPLAPGSDMVLPYSRQFRFGILQSHFRKIIFDPGNQPSWWRDLHFAPRHNVRFDVRVGHGSEVRCPVLWSDSNVVLTVRLDFRISRRHLEAADLLNGLVFLADGARLTPLHVQPGSMRVNRTRDVPTISYVLALPRGSRAEWIRIEIPAADRTAKRNSGRKGRRDRHPLILLHYGVGLTMPE